ncbi:MAG: DUF1559 domain-containing protein [Candidatus Omnitrophica bacterium]|nr:DUF1559 domain-containing protein [Candidatus Omnitrophota bacterium]
MNSKGRKPERAFTLVELLVVIAIIGIVMLMVSSALGKARGAARKAACINNLRQLGIAMQMYSDDHAGVWLDLSTIPSGVGIILPGGIAYWLSQPAIVVARKQTQIGAYWPDYADDPSIYLCPSDKALAGDVQSPLNLKKDPIPPNASSSYSWVYKQGSGPAFSDGCLLHQYPRRVLIFDSFLFHNNAFNGLYSDGSVRSFSFSTTAEGVFQTEAIARYVVQLVP